MKDKAKNALKHKVEVAGKTIPTMILVGLFLVGGGSAALLSTYGTVSGTADVDQAVYIEGASDNTLTAGYDGDLTAGSTTYQQFTVANDANVSADVKFDSNASEVAGITQEVYGSASDQQFNLEQGGDSGSTVVDQTLHVTADPGLNSVTYRAELPTDYFETSAANANFQVSPTDSDLEENYQLTYYPENGDDSWDWRFMTPSASKNTKEYGKEDVEARSEVQSVDYIDNSGSPDVLEVTLSAPAYKQSFGFQATDGGEGYDGFHTAGFSFADESTSGHQVVDQREEVSETVSVPSKGSSTFVSETSFALNLAGGDYTVGLQVEPDTSQEEVTQTS